jgi:hypothetical protein
MIAFAGEMDQLMFIKATAMFVKDNSVVSKG